MSQELLSNIPFDQLQVGQSASLRRTLTEEDIKLLDLVSGESDGQGNGYGIWAASQITTVLSTLLPGPGSRLLAQQLRFLKPLDPGHEVQVALTVREKAEDSPTVVLDCLCRNALGETLVEGSVTALAPTAPHQVPRPSLPRVELYRDHYQAVLARCKELAPVPTAVVHPVDANALRAVKEAAEQGLIEPVLVGPQARILAAARESGIDIQGWPLLDAEHSHAAAAKAVQLAASSQVAALMKGALHSDELMSAVVRSDSGLRTERRISHAYVMEVHGYHKALVITDAAINIAPSLEQKADICQNAIDLWRTLFGAARKPKVALLSAVETVTSRMTSTLDAACLCKMADRGQITDALLDGPLALDNAISPQAAKDKGIASKVAGDADILLVPDIEAGNMLAKQLTFLGHANAAGIVLGARVPIILTSRADSLRTRLLSCAAALFLAEARRRGELK
ncbi:bifunctional enoyl-CoA hydratase/phosphate acetyltransferase [Gallaecimonas kandeliae]|uniref:bifunctional enoyl-CoA hydratase/phosphate acetyltransferase n=1 Tax=Gallaecimonas kandeliae TaxID=3029055 RepID=UPI0026481484|nr:bifunctional enoyl-CoA hydratase/phosphate acetyltransferase [Gallaecimonas kandeliae]WKE66643.1 bifunctional enoyl-CoA hydratase/phosphate acetyltransferase [Gallaecimonas kandeliae]